MKILILFKLTPNFGPFFRQEAVGKRPDLWYDYMNTDKAPGFVCPQAMQGGNFPCPE